MRGLTASDNLNSAHIVPTHHTRSRRFPAVSHSHTHTHTSTGLGFSQCLRHAWVLGQSNQTKALSTSHMSHHNMRGQVTAAAGSSNSVAGGQQQSDSTSYVSITELKELCSKALSTIGYTKDETSILLEVCAHGASLAACMSLQCSICCCICARGSITCHEV